MSFTNAQLAQQIANLIEYWSEFNEEYSNWLGGAVDGGPSSNGYFPLTDYTGAEELVASPAKLADMVDGYVGDASASATAAAASEAAAATSESNAATSETNASTFKDAAAASAAAAAVDEGLAASSQTVATAQANLATDRAGYAEEWANANEDVLVSVAAGGNGVDEYSSKHWAIHTAADAVSTAADAAAAAASAAAAATFDPELFAALADAEVIVGAWDFSTADAAPAALHSRLTANRLYVDGKNAIDGNDTWLRLNNASSFSMGIYTPGALRVDGQVQGGSGGAAWGVTTTGYGTFVSGVAARTGSWSLTYDATNADYVYINHNGTHGYINTGGAGGGNIYLNPALDHVGVITGKKFRIYDTTNADYCEQSHDGTHYGFNFVGTGNVSFAGYTGAMFTNSHWIMAGKSFFMFDGGNTDYVAMYHNGTDFIISGVNTGAIQVTGLSMNFTAGAAARYYDSDNSHWVTSEHDGTNFNITAAVASGLNFSGFTTASFIGARLYVYDATGADHIYIQDTGTAVNVVANANPINFYSQFVSEGRYSMRFSTVGCALGSGYRFTMYDSTGADQLWMDDNGTLSRISTTVNDLALYTQSVLRATLSATGLAVVGTVTGSNLNVSNWDTAYGWGNHASTYEPLNAKLFRHVTTGYNSANVTVGTTAPVSPAQGDIWFDTN